MAYVYYCENTPKEAAITYRRLRKSGVPAIYYGGRRSIIRVPVEYDSQARAIVGWDQFPAHKPERAFFLKI